MGIEPWSLHSPTTSSRWAIGAELPSWMGYGRSNLVVYLPQSGDRLRRAGRLWFAPFSRIKHSRPNWDANSWQDMLSDDTLSLRRLPSRSSKNYDLQFANGDRFKANDRVDARFMFFTPPIRHVPYLFGHVSYINKSTLYIDAVSCFSHHHVKVWRA